MAGDGGALEGQEDARQEVGPVKMSIKLMITPPSFEGSLITFTSFMTVTTLITILYSNPSIHDDPITDVAWN